MKWFLFAAAALALPLAAAAETYDCETKNFGRGGWVPERIVLDYDTKAGVGTALDGLIKHLHGKPIPVEWSKRSDTSFIFRWTLKGLKATNGGTGINTYKVTLFTAQNKFSLSGRRHGYDNVISGSGTCKRVK
ncbi:MAG: hypothetical protein ACJAVM_002974 [Sulfitobacter sp.]|jgi:hypothetical protein